MRRFASRRSTSRRSSPRAPPSSFFLPTAAAASGGLGGISFAADSLPFLVHSALGRTTRRKRRRRALDRELSRSSPSPAATSLGRTSWALGRQPPHNKR